jgi:antitoxin ParD1/3/4
VIGSGGGWKIGHVFAKARHYDTVQPMTISLTQDQLDWINAHVASGEFLSAEDAIRQLLDERIAERDAEQADDLAWAKPHVDEARAEVARGEFLTLEAERLRIDAQLASSGRSAFLAHSDETARGSHQQKANQKQVNISRPDIIVRCGSAEGSKPQRFVIEDRHENAKPWQ